MQICGLLERAWLAQATCVRQNRAAMSVKVTIEAVSEGVQSLPSFHAQLV